MTPSRGNSAGASILLRAVFSLVQHVSLRHYAQGMVFCLGSSVPHQVLTADDDASRAVIEHDVAAAACQAGSQRKAALARIPAHRVAALAVVLDLAK